MLKDILSITGKSGLFKMVSSTSKHLIVESLNEKKRIPINSLTKVISLEDVAIYTEEDTVSMKDVFKSISNKEGGKECSINPRKAEKDEMSSYFKEVVPDYDTDRVYISDMKKTLLWYNELVKNDLLHLLEDDEQDENKAEESE